MLPKQYIPIKQDKNKKAAPGITPASKNVLKLIGQRYKNQISSHPKRLTCRQCIEKQKPIDSHQQVIKVKPWQHFNCPIISEEITKNNEQSHYKQVIKSKIVLENEVGVQTFTELNQDQISLQQKQQATQTEINNKNRLSIKTVNQLIDGTKYFSKKPFFGYQNPINKCIEKSTMTEYSTINAIQQESNAIIQYLSDILRRTKWLIDPEHNIDTTLNILPQISQYITRLKGQIDDNLNILFQMLLKKLKEQKQQFMNTSLSPIKHMHTQEQQLPLSSKQDLDDYKPHFSMGDIKQLQSTKLLSQQQHIKDNCNADINDFGQNSEVLPYQFKEIPQQNCLNYQSKERQLLSRYGIKGLQIIYGDTNSLLYNIILTQAQKIQQQTHSQK